MPRRAACAVLARVASTSSSAPGPVEQAGRGPWDPLITLAPRPVRAGVGVLSAAALAVGLLAVLSNPEAGTLGALGLALGFVGLAWLPVPLLVPPPGGPRAAVLARVPVVWRDVVERAVRGEGVPADADARAGATALARWEQQRVARLVLPCAALAAVCVACVLAVSRGAPPFALVLPLAPVQLLLALRARRHLRRVLRALEGRT